MRPIPTLASKVLRLAPQGVAVKNEGKKGLDSSKDPMIRRVGELFRVCGLLRLYRVKLLNGAILGHPG